MDNKFMTRAEMKAQVQTELTKCDDEDLKWLYCYFSEFDEWPLITDPPVRKTRKHGLNILDEEEELAG